MSETRVRRATESDIPPLLELQEACYPALRLVSRWGPHHLRSHQERFPEGQMVAQEGGRIVGFSACFLTDSKVALEPHTFREITGLGTFQTHRPGGDTLYGAEIMVHPEHRRHGIAKLFYRARFELARRLGVRYFVAGGRIPGYGDHKGRMSAEQYVAKVVSGELADRVLSAQLASGLKVRRILPNYLNDPKSLNYATLLVWENPEVAPRATAQRRRRPTHVGPGKVSR